uniref:Uncharacterized protein n=1 Tax=Pararge aegeria TaxID=116150 RepID=S4NXD1_9NEOP
MTTTDLRMYRTLIKSLLHEVHCVQNSKNTSHVSLQTCVMLLAQKLPIFPMFNLYFFGDFYPRRHASPIVTYTVKIKQNKNQILQLILAYYCMIQG